MADGLNIVIYIVMGALVLILVAGLWSMFRGGGRLSQNLMRARVIVQFVAVILLMVSIYFFGPGR
jgi:predicted membrane channel-forming protein YqfA (hemolysin III family)